MKVECSCGRWYDADLQPFRCSCGQKLRLSEEEQTAQEEALLEEAEEMKGEGDTEDI